MAHLPVEDAKNDQKDWWKAVGRDLVGCTSGTSALRGVGNSNKNEIVFLNRFHVLSNTDGDEHNLESESSMGNQPSRSRLAERGPAQPRVR